MTAKELKKKFIDFFEKKGHQLIPSSSLIPENDPSVLFTTAGMHPLVPYLLGEVHPQGRKLCSLQRCLRTDDIDNVGDGFHHTFFEMLGNWSLGEYWKEKAIEYSWEFLTKVLNFDSQSISVSCFVGDKDAAKDEESALIWQKVGIPEERIFYLPKKDNWWGPVGQTGPCGPDSEMFIDTGKPKCGSKCDVSCQCGKYIEVWNNVFMQYNKTLEGKYEPLKQKNVDTGMGVERVVAITSGFGEDDYRTELFWPMIQEIEKISGKNYEEATSQKPMRIIADHLRAAVFLITDGVVPSNTEQGYILRRLIRRAIRYGQGLKMGTQFTTQIANIIFKMKMADSYPQLGKNKKTIIEQLGLEENKFSKALNRGLKEIKKFKKLDGKIAFYLYESYGFPWELTEEIARERRQKIEKEVFEKEFKKHQKLSREGAEKKFAGGLANHSEQVIKYHTATHLLHAALRKVLGNEVHQIGSNLTAERLRFDFTYPDKLMNTQIRQVESLANKIIEKKLPVEMEIMGLDEARKGGALAFFEYRYGEKVKVYTVKDDNNFFSKEVCGGPHVTNTGEIGGIEIFKEESSGAGKRRIYARLK